MKVKSRKWYLLWVIWGDATIVTFGDKPDNSTPKKFLSFFFKNDKVRTDFIIYRDSDGDRVTDIEASAEMIEIAQSAIAYSALTGCEHRKVNDFPVQEFEVIL